MVRTSSSRLRTLGRRTFNVTQNFAISYICRASQPSPPVFPSLFRENDDNSLAGTLGIDHPQLTGDGLLVINKNPRSGQPYFNPAYFTTEPIGQIGNANRRFLVGPGLDNFDVALLKNTNITESKVFQLRVEAFNIFNHAQFFNPDGNVNSNLSGVVTGAWDPRLLQLALKFTF